MHDPRGGWRGWKLGVRYLASTAVVLVGRKTTRYYVEAPNQLGSSGTVEPSKEDRVRHGSPCRWVHHVAR